MDNILVAIDGSEHSKKAVELAIDLAHLWNTSIYFIHVRRERENIPRGYEEYARLEGISPSEFYARVNGVEPFVSGAEKKAKVRGIGKIECIIEQGDPANEILRTAERIDADLIVMGSRGLGRFSRAILGSVSTKVLNHTECTCITVK
jgi:nucleotide-binding universal stress UspA family protein